MLGIRTTATGVAFAAAFVLSASAGQAGEIGWEKYMNSAASVAAIAAAVAMVDQCSKPLEISETRQNGQILLTFNCTGGEDEEASATVRFDDFGGTLVPNGYLIAG